MGLDIFEWLNGILLLVFLSIYIIVGLKIALVYLKSKNKNFLAVGFAWIGIVTPWFPAAISFLLYIFYGATITYELAMIIGLLFLAPCTILWVYAFTDLLGLKKRRNLILLVLITYSCIIEVILLYYLFNSPEEIVFIGGPVDVDLGGIFVTPFIFSELIILEISGLLFSWRSIISNSPELKLKGRILGIAFLMFAIGGILDIFSSYSIVFLTLARVILILCSLMFYFGFILPSFIKKAFLKDN